MPPHQRVRCGLHGGLVQMPRHPMAGVKGEGVIHPGVEQVIAVRLGVGGVTGMELLRHRPGLQHADGGGQVGVQRRHQLFRRHPAVIMKIQRKAPGVYPRVGAGAALHIGAAAQHGLHGVLQRFAHRHAVGLHLKPRVVRALVGKPKQNVHANKNLVQTMIPRRIVRTTAQRTSSLPNFSTFSRVRPSPPW